MSTKTVFNTMDDLVFENRHRDYGAYELRANYDNRMVKAMLVAFGIMGFLALLPTVYGKMNPQEIKQDDFGCVITLVDPPKVETIRPTPPPPQQNNPPPMRDQIAFVDPTVRNDVDVPTETLPPSKTDLANADLGSTTQAGDPNGSILSDPNQPIVTSSGPVETVTPVVEPPKTFNNAEVDQKPIFPDGEAALLKYLAENIHYPTLAREAGIQGRVVVSFIIAKDGSIESANVVRGIGGGCDQEAIKVINKMPQWQPGMVKGRPVKVKFTLPIVFSLRQ